MFYHNFRYRAGSWDQARRVVVKIAWHAGELFPRVGCIVTNLNWRSKRVVRFYNKRGTVEQWIKEGKNAVNWAKLSCRRFKDNEARLHLFALAYNLANFLRQLVLPKSVRSWTLTTPSSVNSSPRTTKPQPGRWLNARSRHRSPHGARTKRQFQRMDSYGGLYSTGMGLNGYSGSNRDTLLPFDTQEAWMHGYFQEIGAYPGYTHFRPYNYKHVFSQVDLSSLGPAAGDALLAAMVVPLSIASVIDSTSPNADVAGAVEL